MKLFEELDSIIENAVNETMKDERTRQQSQSKKIEKLGLRAADVKKDGVDEADDDEADDEAQDKLKGEPEDSTDPGESVSSDDAPGTATSKKLKDPSKKQIERPTFKAIANNINLLRGGKSIKDPEVRKNLQDYIDKLTNDERRQVLVYLNSLAQVMSGVKSGAAAAGPKQAKKSAEKKSVTPAKKVDNIDTSVIVVGE